MSNVLLFDFALHEPAMAIAPVFLVFSKKERKKLDVTFEFGGSVIKWRGADALGMLEQSVLLTLISAAKQQQFRLSPSNPSSTGALLLPLLAMEGPELETALRVVIISWNRLAGALGYSSSGGKNINIVKDAVRRLAETTIWETREGKTYQSRVLAWIVGDDAGVTIVLNRRATDALCGGQFVKISLVERRQLDDDRSKALHAWLSGHLRQGLSQSYAIDSLQVHVWGGEASGNSLSSRRARLRHALRNIDALELWKCEFLSKRKVLISRSRVGTFSIETPDFQQ